MLSKSRGHVLRVAAVLHVLFHYKETSDYTIPEEITESAVEAATNFVMVSCQQTAYIAGRGSLTEEVERFKSGMSNKSISSEVK